MSELVRFGVSLEEELLTSFDQHTVIQNTIMAALIEKPRKSR